MTTAFEDLLIAANDFATMKKAYTAKLTEIANKYNAHQPITAADWTALISGAYDPLTLTSNNLCHLVGTLEAGLLIDEALRRIKEPATNLDLIYQFAGTYFTLANLMFYAPDLVTARALMDSVATAMDKIFVEEYGPPVVAEVPLDPQPTAVYSKIITDRIPPTT